MNRITKLTVSILVLMSLALSVSIGAFAANDGNYAGKVTTSSTGLNVRLAASSSSSIKTSIAKGSYVSLVSKEGGWWKVEYAAGSYGYCSADYIQTVSSDARYVKTSGSNLNVRYGSGTSYSVKSQLANGTKIIALSESSGWTYILYNGTATGYVSSLYLSSGQVQGSEDKDEYKAIKLDVPYYNQKDSRWSSVTLGSSSRTVGTSGCTTTCIAMAYSYINGYTITPAYLAQTLSYSSSGDLYWPSGTVQYYSSDYLKLIYEQLSSGKPVLVGAKTSSGGQHWVIATGFTGGELTAVNIIINDPGVASRTRLSQFFSAFPIYYKAVYFK